MVTIPSETVSQPLDNDVPPVDLDLGLGRSTIAEDVASRLITAIAVGTYSPGEQLPPERELAVRLSVSRATVRQALQQVAELGLIESRRGRGGGTFVTKRSWEEQAREPTRRTLQAELPRLRELFDLRGMVEGMIARAAAQRRTAADVTELESLLAQFTAASADMTTARALDRRLHAAICSAAGNSYLQGLSARLATLASLGFGALPYEPDFFRQALHEHEALVRAVVCGDAESAQRLAADHTMLTYRSMQASLTWSEQDPPDASRPG